LNPVDKLMAQAQIAFTAIFFLLLFTIIILFELGFASHLNDAQQKTFDATLAYLKDAGLVIVGFWFARLRGGGIPDATTVTQTLTAPDGSKASVTSPAHLPLPSIANPIQPVTPAPLTESPK
jgi:hypothetical protein